MSRFLVFSDSHLLLPLAWRLVKDHHDVDTIVRRNRFEGCWDGKLAKLLRGTQKKADSPEMTKLVEAVVETGTTVLTDSKVACRMFSGYARLFGVIHEEAAVPLPSICLCAWFDGDGSWSGRSLWFEDKGLWPGGLGAKVAGGGTLVRPNAWPASFELALDRVGAELKARDFRGMVKVGIGLAGANPDSEEPTVVGFRAGWPFLATHAFIADQTGDLGPLFEGAPAELPSRFTVVLPVSVPPWPLGSTEGSKPVNAGSDIGPVPMGLVTSNACFFHDMAIKGERAMIAGTDGLVGVVRGSAQTFELARGRALGLAQAAAQELPEAQVRLDVGARVPLMLAQLEEAGLGV